MCVWGCGSRLFEKKGGVLMLRSLSKSGGLVLGCVCEATWECFFF